MIHILHALVWAAAVLSGAWLAREAGDDGFLVIIFGIAGYTMCAGFLARAGSR